MNQKQQIYIIFQAHTEIKYAGAYRSIRRLIEQMAISPNSKTSMNSKLTFISLKKKK